MTENEAKSFMLIEKECINRDCNRDCAKCDIVQEVDNLNNAYDMAIKALEEVQQYRQIGTVEECREAVEKQTAKKPTLIDYKKYANFVDNAHFLRDAYWCPNCKQVVRSGSFCDGCGQKLDWSVNDENTN
jgi:hypothetical protein